MGSEAVKSVRAGALAFAVLCVVLGVRPAPAAAQFFATCRDGSERDLDKAIRAHDEQTDLLHRKFVTGWYGKALSPDFVPTTRIHVQAFLRALRPRRAAVLFYAHDEGRGRFCTWLLGEDGVLASHVAPMREGELLDLHEGMLRSIGASGIAVRGPVRRRQLVPFESLESIDVGVTPDVASERLLPPSVRSTLEAKRIDTLTIIPISVLGTLPFAALPFGDGQVVDLAAITVAPGFFAFRALPKRATSDFTRAVVVGDPRIEDSDWDVPPLPGARAEASQVAKLVGADAWIGNGATKTRVEAAAKSEPLGLVYLATHGVASSLHPRDASLLFMSDGVWPAAEIQNLRLPARPLVVLSACQTGLGKDFGVGTIGMARAWHYAGAGSVVMSFWNVNDESTAELMTDFLRRARGAPPEIALRAAMLAARERHSDPASWAGFGVFGVPGRVSP